MTSLERALSAVKLDLPDRVPVDLHNFCVAAEMLGKSYGDVFTDGKKIAESQILAWEEFRHDILLVEVGTTTTAEAVGCTVQYRNSDAPLVREPLLKNLQDVDKLEVPDPYRSGLQMGEMLKAVRILKERIGDEVFIMGRADQGPFDLATQLRGYDKFLLDLAERRELDLVHKLLDFCRRVTTQYACALIDAGAHATSIGESAAGPDVVSPVVYEEFAFTYERKMIQELKAKRILIANHICGNVDSIIDKMVATGASIIEIDHKANLKKAKEAARGRTCLLGPIDTERLRTGTPREIENLSREAIKIAAPGGGYILGPGCAMAGDTPLENIRALVESAKKHGAYTHDT